MILTAADIERFESKVDRSGECHLWTKGTFDTGYGQFHVASYPYGAHRIAWLIATGKWPPTWVLHTCDTPACVRFEHLFLGTTQDNTADRQSKGRQARGERQHLAKLTASDVRQARARYASGGETVLSLARSYGVSTSSMWAALTHRSWRHVERTESLA